MAGDVDEKEIRLVRVFSLFFFYSWRFSGRLIFKEFHSLKLIYFY